MNANVDLSGIRIKTERLILRPFQEEDLEDFFQYASVPGVGEMAGWKHHESREQTKKILDSFIQEKKTLALVDLESGHVVGSLGLENLTQSSYSLSKLSGREIGYVLSKDYWGEGLMPEAVKSIMQYCFTTLSFDFLVISHFPENQQSKRVIEKTGFIYDGEYFFKAQDASLKKASYYHILNPNKEIEIDW